MDVNYVYYKGGSWYTGAVASTSNVNETRPAVTVEGMNSQSFSTTGNIHVAYWESNDIKYKESTYASPGTFGAAVKASNRTVSGTCMTPAIVTQNISSNDYPIIAYTSSGASNDIYVTAEDGIAPANPTANTSTPALNTWSTASNVQVSWSGASDTNPGEVSRYYWVLDSASNTVPNSSANNTTATSLNTPIIEGSNVYIHVRSRDWASNFAAGAYHIGPFKIDRTAPGNPASLTSISHTVNSWSNDSTIDVNWSGASDPLSGVAGYSYSWDTSCSTIPDTTSEGAGASTTSPAQASGNSYYFHLRTVDGIGNWNSTAIHLGPFWIDIKAPNDPTSMASTSHIVSSWSNDSTIDVIWSGASDLHSGVGGYSYVWDTSPSTDPDTASEGAQTSTTSPALTSGNAYYFHLGTVDAVGNLNSTAMHLGPFWIDITEPDNPTSLTSTSHTLSEWSNDSTVDIGWSGASDGQSGIAGYSYVWDTSPSTIPDTTSEGTGTCMTSPSLSSGNSHYFHLRTVDAVGNWNSTAIHLGPFWVDTVPPTDTTIIINDGATYTTSTSVNFKLNATDSLSGPAMMAFSFDGTTWTAWEAYATFKQFTLPGPDGTNTVQVRIRDALGNEVAPPYPNDTIVLDRTPPTSSVVSLPEKSSPKYTVSWAGDDATSGVDFWTVQYREGDTGAWTDWQDKVAFTSAQFNGTVGKKYYFRSQAQDKAGNLEPAHVAFDTSTTVTNMPSLLVTVVPDKIFVGEALNITVTASKNDTPIAGMAISLSSNGGTLNSTSGLTDSAGKFLTRFTSSTNGTFVITVKGDMTGYDHVETSISISVEERPVQILNLTIQSPLPNATVTDKVTISGIASSGVIQVQVRIGQQDDWHTVSGATSWNYIWDTTNFTNGDYRIYARAFDGKQYSATAEQKITVANVPKIAIVNPPSQEKVKGILELQGSTSSYATKVVYQIDDGQFMDANLTPAAWKISVDTKDLKDGSHTIKIKASSGAVESPVETYTFSTRNHTAKEAEGITPLLLAIPILVIVIVVVVALVMMIIRKRRRPVVHLP